MPFYPSIQFLPAQATVGGANHQCAVNWGTNKVFIADSAYVTRTGILTGVEEDYESVVTYGGPHLPPIGGDTSGNVYVTRPVSIYSGGINRIDGSTLAVIDYAIYPPSYFGGGGFASIQLTNGNQAVLDVGVGGSFVALCQAILTVDIAITGLFNWGSYGPNALVCAGKLNTNKIYLIAHATTSFSLFEISCYPTFSNIVVGTLFPADIEPTWTTFGIQGFCVDQTDGNLIVVGNNNALGPARKNRVFKIDSNDASILWNIEITSGSTILNVDKQFAYSLIRRNRIALLINNNPLPVASPRIDIYDTTNGSVIDTYTTGLTGISPTGFQCYNDAVEGVICNIDYVDAVGSPTRLNSTPSSFRGWAMLYVASPPAPPPGNRRFLAECGPVRTGAPSSSPIIPPTPPPPPPPPAVVTNIITLSGDPLITLSGSNIITDT